MINEASKMSVHLDICLTDSRSFMILHVRIYKQVFFLMNNKYILVVTDMYIVHLNKNDDIMIREYYMIFYLEGGQVGVFIPLLLIVHFLDEYLFRHSMTSGSKAFIQSIIQDFVLVLSKYKMIIVCCKHNVLNSTSPLLIC